MKNHLFTETLCKTYLPQLFRKQNVKRVLKTFFRCFVYSVEMIDYSVEMIDSKETQKSYRFFSAFGTNQY